MSEAQEREACMHEHIRMWRDAKTGEPVGLWSCANCERRFEPVQDNRSQRHQSAQRLAPLVAVLLREGLAQEAMELEEVYKELTARSQQDRTPQEVGSMSMYASSADYWKARAEAAEELLDYLKQRQAERAKRLWHWAHERLGEELKTEYFNIVANGTASASESPTYAQLLNQAKHRAEAAEAKLAEAQKDAASMAKFIRSIDHGDGEHPNHSHLVPGVWDTDNKPEIAGKPCDECAMWRAAIDAAMQQGADK